MIDRGVEAERVVVGELVLDRFLVQRRLGSGGFGTVYEAWDERLERDVAVKVIEPAEGGGRRVLREAQAAARLNHPGIVTLYELGEEDGQAVLVSELVEGQTLRSLSLAGRLSDRDVAEVGAELCDALAHAHSRGVVHRDVKPQNILLCKREPRARLMDFGIARVADASRLTATGSVVGTLAYMAPEQAEGDPAGPAADVFGLALTLYECWTGENPRLAGTPAATLRALAAPLPALGRLRPDLPAEICEEIDAALDPDPSLRPSPPELGAVLAAGLGELDDSRAVPRPDGEGILARIGTGGAVDQGCAVLLGGLVAAAMAAVGGPALPWALALVPLVAALTLVRVRLGYLTAALGLCAWLAFAAGRPGAAVVLAALAIPPALLLGDGGRVPLLPAAAPLLGLAGLAAAFPAFAGCAPRWRQRVVLAATGCIWLAATEVVLRRDLYLGAGADPPRGWRESAQDGLTEVLVPLLADPRLLAHAGIWVLAALLAGVLLAPLRIWAAGGSGARAAATESHLDAPAAAPGEGGRQAALP